MSKSVNLVDVILRQRVAPLSIPETCPKCGAEVEESELVIRYICEGRSHGGVAVESDGSIRADESDADDKQHVSQVLTGCCEHPLLQGGYRRHALLTTPAEDVRLEATCVVESLRAGAITLQGWRAMTLGPVALVQRLEGQKWCPVAPARWDGEALTSRFPMSPHVLQALSSALLGQAALAALKQSAE